MRLVLSRLLPFALFLSVVLACANLPANKQLRNNTNPTASSGPTSTSTPRGVLWGYREYDDEMGRGKVFFTSIESTNTISLGFPYEGEQHGYLSIREHPAFGKDVYLRIEKGQLLDSDYHSRVVARFDNDKAIAFPTVKPSDLSSETLFLRGNAFPVFINRLKTAKTLRVEVPVYQSGNQVLIFDVEGFTWKRQK